MPYRDETNSMIAALLLLERQAAKAWLWQFEWAVVTMVALAAILLVEIIFGPTYGMITLTAAFIAILNGCYLVLCERRGLRRLSKIYHDIVSEHLAWSPPFKIWPFWYRRG